MPGILVANWLQERFDAGYFNTGIRGKDVFAPLRYNGGFLPIGLGAKFPVVEKGKKPSDDDWVYKRVLFADEETLGDLYRNACAYQYNADADAYLKLPEKGARKNALKFMARRSAIEIGGDPYDRIADLSRMVVFLLSKAALSENERKILSPLLARAKSAYELADVFNREKNILRAADEITEPEAGDGE